MSQQEPAVDRRAEEPALPTIWEILDALWDKIILPFLLERARTGCQWNQLPETFGSNATVHRILQRWDSKGIFDCQ